MTTPKVILDAPRPNLRSPRTRSPSTRSGCSYQRGGSSALTGHSRGTGRAGRSVAGARPDRSLVKRVKGLLDITSVTGSEPASKAAPGGRPTPASEVGEGCYLRVRRGSYLRPNLPPYLRPRQNRKRDESHRARSCMWKRTTASRVRACLPKTALGPTWFREEIDQRIGSDHREHRWEGSAIALPGLLDEADVWPVGLSPLIAVTRSRSQPALPARPRSSLLSSGGEPVPALPALLAGPR